MQKKLEIGFVEALVEKCGVEKGMNILLAVSGGMDSMCLAELFLIARKKEILTFDVAHVNYGLRNEESDGDQKLVEDWANKKEVHCHVLKEKLEKKSGQSTQMAARDVRYEWFEKIRIENKYDRIATAHHLNDSLETALINFSAGTGIAGLKGVQYVNGKLIRPLLDFSREEISDYVRENNILFREDSSNATDIYVRNKIRHKVVPVLEEINPALLSGFAKTSAILRDGEILLAEVIALYRKKWFKKKGNDYSISILEVKKHPASASILFGALQEFGFNAADVSDLLSSIKNSGSGKIFQSKTHRIIRDRKHLILTALSSSEDQQNSTDSGYFLITETTSKLQIPGFLLTIESKNPEKYTTENMDKVALFEKSKVKFPLTVRKWESGDYFYPKGLLKKSGKPGKKKLKKYFSDQKMSLLDKERIWVLADAEQHVLWLIGERQDHRFFPSPESSTILRIKIKKRN